jgi:hypothetical protein
MTVEEQAVISALTGEYVVGQRVKITSGPLSSRYKTGTVVRIEPDSSFPIHVDFDKDRVRRSCFSAFIHLQRWYSADELTPLVEDGP